MATRTGRKRKELDLETQVVIVSHSNDYVNNYYLYVVLLSNEFLVNRRNLKIAKMLGKLLRMHSKQCLAKSNQDGFGVMGDQLPKVLWRKMKKSVKLNNKLKENDILRI